MTQFVFPPLAFIPVVIGLFGPGTGYFIWGGYALFGYKPPDNSTLSKSLNMLPALP